MRRRWWLILLLFLLIVLHVGGGWYFADQLRVDALVPDNTISPPDVAIVSVEAGVVAMTAVEGTDPELTAPGSVGLDWGTGYGQLGPGSTTDGDRVVRSLIRLDGAPPTAGMLATIDGNAFPGDPERAFGLAFSEENYQGPLGPVGSWKILAPGNVWVVHVHGLGAPRSEALRMVGPLAEAGYPQMVIDYRNDPEAPADPSGYYRYGQTEWEDVEAAVDRAIENGASKVVLVGYSTGAAHILSYLYHQPDAPVIGVILDSPNLDFEQTVDLGASQRRLPVVPLPIPGTLVWTAKRIAALRYGLSWSATNYLPEVDQLRVPVLVFHGNADETVPLASSQQFASLRPDLVRLVIVPGAGHVRSWNLSPEAYERRIVEFLDEVAG